MFSKQSRQWRDRLRMYVLCTAGTIAAAFALMAPVLIGATGMALDLAQSYNVRQRLCASLDASALAAAASFTEPDDIEERVQQFFETNFPEEVLGTAFDLQVTVTDEDVIVSAYARYDTTFMRSVGIPDMTMFCQTTVHREIRGLEVVLVLDNTGSMSYQDNIGTLQDATENFINILFDSASEDEYVKIGLVPYANSVRIGRYGLGRNPDNTVYGDGTVFVTQPQTDVTYTTSHTSTSRWYGCVVEHYADNYDEDSTHVGGSYGQFWRDPDTGVYNGHGWDITQDDNDPYPQDIIDDYEGPWDIYMKGEADTTTTTTSTCTSYYTDSSHCSCRTSSRGRCTAYWTDPAHCSCRTYSHTTTTTYSYDLASSPNDGCPYAYILPLSSDQDELLDRVDDMQAHGNTLSNAGIIWGYRLISPEAPFTEGAAWDNQEWKKAIIVMTDGDNTRDNTYNYFGPADQNELDVDDYNERFLEVCEAMKEKDVIIYTVVFQSQTAVTEETKDYYKNCASSEDQYFYAPTQDELIDVFERISRELSQIHISG